MTPRYTNESHWYTTVASWPRFHREVAGAIQVKRSVRVSQAGHSTAACGDARFETSGVLAACS